MQDLVGVSVADPAEQARIGQCPLERVVLDAESPDELRFPRVERLESPALEGGEGGLSGHQVQRSASLGAGLGEEQRAIVEVERGEADLSRRLGSGRDPAQPPGDHEMDDDEELVLQLPHEALAHPAKEEHPAAGERGEGWIDGAEDERVRQSDGFQPAAEDAALERLQIDHDVRKLWHLRSGSVDARGRAPPAGWKSRGRWRAPTRRRTSPPPDCRIAPAAACAVSVRRPEC